ncbi:MAG: SRPBCC family protein [Vicinamibacterales bacterium]
MRHHLTARLELPLPLDRVFRFFGAAENLQRITPPELGFRILTPLPIEMRPGALIDYRIRLFGLPLRWRTEITEWDPPHRFVDIQLRGPYREWTHTHTFEPTPDGRGTIIHDHVQYQLPLTPLGDLAWPIVRLQLRRIFAYRERATRQQLLTAGQEHRAG